MAACFHIRWSRDGKLDWECHSSKAAAEASAKELVRPGESYSIESFRHDQKNQPPKQQEAQAGE